MFPIRDNIPSERRPVITVALIVINLAVFASQLAMSDVQLATFAHLHGVVPRRFTQPAWGELHGFPELSVWPLFSYMFLHGGWLHVIMNMWMLWIFGDNVEDRMGHVKYALFYVTCGVLAALTHMLFNPYSTLPAIGASGAVAGVLGAYYMYFRRAWVLTLVILVVFPLFVPVPAVVFILLWFFSQFFSGAFSLLEPGEGGGIAWWAHIGGFLAGVWLCRYLGKPPREQRGFAD